MTHIEFIERFGDVERLPHLLPTRDDLGATYRSHPEDFIVHEIPAYGPSGTGEHLFVHFEKTGLNTLDAVRKIAAGLGIELAGAGYAGMKDRHAVTRQWASFPGGDPARARALELDGIRILDAAMHDQKLRTGHLQGNRFSLRLHSPRPDFAELVRPRMEALASTGFPNYFGAQRFGKSRTNLARAASWLLDGGRAPRQRFMRKLQVSSLQSAVFNAVLAERVAEGLLGVALDGDVMRKEQTGGLFVCEDVQTDGPRLESFEISPTGPLFGKKMRRAERRAGVREDRAREAAGLTSATLARFGAAGRGSRRVLRVRPRDARVQAAEGGARVEFTLPKGAYATVLLRELLGCEPTEASPTTSPRSTPRPADAASSE